MSTARSATSGSNSRGAVDTEIPGSPDAQPSSASRSERSRLKPDAEDFVPRSLSQGMSDTGSNIGNTSAGCKASETSGGSSKPDIIDGDEVSWLNQMAWDHGVNTSRVDDEGPYKLFVGCLPFDTTEHDLYPLFAQFGEIVELAIQRDREGRSKGCAWLKYITRESCDECISRLHGQFYVGHVRAAMQVKYATGELEKRENRVYLIGLPKDEMVMAEHELLTALDTYGEIREFMLFRADGKSTGACFVKYTAREPAAALVQACHLREFRVNSMHLPAVRAYFASPIRRFSSTMTSSSSQRSPVDFQAAAPNATNLNAVSVEEGLGNINSEAEGGSAISGNTGTSTHGGPRAESAATHGRAIDTSSNLTSTGLLRPAVANVENNSESRPPPSVFVPNPNLPQEDLTPAKLFVGCLPYSKTTFDLAQLFGQFGPIREVALLTNAEGKSKGAAFITFAFAPDAEAAMVMNNYCFAGSSRSINVSYATNQTWVPGGINNNSNTRNARTGGGASSRMGGGTQSYFPLKHSISGAYGNSPPVMFTSNRYGGVSSVASTAYDQSPPTGPMPGSNVVLPIEAIGHEYHQGDAGSGAQSGALEPSPTGTFTDSITNWLLEYEESLSSELPPL